MNIFKVNPKKIKYTDTSKISPDYTDRMNKEYNWMARGYDAFMFLFPFWKKWIKKVIPHIEGQKILEVSFGNGYLMTQYAKDGYEVHGIDYNEKMLDIAAGKLKAKYIQAKLSKANVEKLPFADNTFDTVINTMAFSGYPDGAKAMRELRRVLKTNGRLLLVDFDYPKNRNVAGYLIVKLWEKLGDIIKDISAQLTKYDFDWHDIAIGGCGSVHLFIAQKRT